MNVGYSLFYKKMNSIMLPIITSLHHADKPNKSEAVGIKNAAFWNTMLCSVLDR